MTRPAGTKIYTTLKIGNRRVLVAIFASWTVLPVTQSGQLLIEQIDDFVTAQIARSCNCPSTGVSTAWCSSNGFCL
jgi:hypothetical protein